MKKCVKQLFAISLIFVMCCGMCACENEENLPYDQIKNMEKLEDIKTIVPDPDDAEEIFDDMEDYFAAKEFPDKSEDRAEDLFEAKYGEAFEEAAPTLEFMKKPEFLDYWNSLNIKNSGRILNELIQLLKNGLSQEELLKKIYDPDDLDEPLENEDVLEGFYDGLIGPDGKPIEPPKEDDPVNPGVSGGGGSDPKPQEDDKEIPEVPEAQIPPLSGSCIIYGQWNGTNLPIG